MTSDKCVYLYHRSKLPQILATINILVQWNPSCNATPFASEKWPFKRGGLLSGVEINTFMYIFTLPSGFSREGGLSKGVPLYN